MHIYVQKKCVFGHTIQINYAMLVMLLKKELLNYASKRACASLNIYIDEYFFAIHTMYLYH